MSKKEKEKEMNIREIRESIKKSQERERREELVFQLKCLLFPLEKLRGLFMEKLPRYMDKRIGEIKDEKKHARRIREMRKNTNQIVVDTKRPYCRSISSLVSLCLEPYGFSTSVRNVQFLLGNKRAMEIFEKYGIQGITRAVETGNPPDLYTIGVAMGRDPDPADFHSVVQIEDTILDMTADQMHRPEHGIHMENFWLPIPKIKEKIPHYLIYRTTLPIYPAGIIFTHPQIDKIVNTISYAIAKKLGKKPRHVSFRDKIATDKKRDYLVR